jgi:hypothetical protein
MKAELIEITKEMTGSTELAEALMKNFNGINDMAIQRETAIFDRLTQIKNDLSAKIDTWGRDLDSKISKTDSKINTVDKKLDVLLKHFGIDPNLLTEE